MMMMMMNWSEILKCMEKVKEPIGDDMKKIRIF
jgi:hypothetical protein